MEQGVVSQILSDTASYSPRSHCFSSSSIFALQPAPHPHIHSHILLNHIPLAILYDTQMDVLINTSNFQHHTAQTSSAPRPRQPNVSKNNQIKHTTEEISASFNADPNYLHDPLTPTNLSTPNSSTLAGIPYQSSQTPNRKRSQL